MTSRDPATGEMREPVWAKFLTDFDRRHLALVPTSKRGLGTVPALLLIDLYRKAFGDEPHELLDGVDAYPGSCGMAGWNALPSIRQLLDTARSLQIPVIHVTGGSDIPRWSDSIREGGQRRAPAGSAQRRADYEIIAEVAPRAGEIVISKYGPSGFSGTPLASALRSLEIDSLLIGGESTSGCVRATVVDACSYHYRVAVVEDCVFDRHEATHALSLFDMDRKYADVVSLDEAQSYLHQLAP